MRAIGMVVALAALAGCSNGAYQLPTVRGRRRGAAGGVDAGVARRGGAAGPGAGEGAGGADLRAGGGRLVGGDRRALPRLRAATSSSTTVVTPVRRDSCPTSGRTRRCWRRIARAGRCGARRRWRPSFSWPEEGRPSAPTRFWWGGGWWWGYEKTGYMSYPDIAVALR